MRCWVLSLVLTAFLAQQPYGAAVTRRTKRSAPCLVDADCLVFQECVWDRADPDVGPTGICLAVGHRRSDLWKKKYLIRRAALKQEPTNSPPAPRPTPIGEVKAKTASKRVKHDTSAYLPGAFGDSNEPTRFYNQNYGRTSGGTSEKVFYPNQDRRSQDSQQYQGSSPLSGRERSVAWPQKPGWPTDGGSDRGVQNTGPKQATPGIIILPSLGQNHGYGKWQPNFVYNNVAGKSLTHANPPTYGTKISLKTERKPAYISGPTTGGQQAPQVLPKGKFSTTDSHGMAPSSGHTEEHTSEGRDDWRSHVTTFREDSTDQEIVLDNSKDVNFVEAVPEHAESNRGHSPSQGAITGGRFHGVSRENREKAGNHQARRQDVLRIQEQNSKLHDLLESPREVHVKQHPKEQVSNIPTGNHAIFDPILGEPTGVEDDVDEVDVGSRREQTMETDKDYF